ncbi:MAG: DNA repair protein RecO [Rhodospirillales bacterium]|nr:DNA repair protein RecO [Rhodospirillales bacterium]
MEWSDTGIVLSARRHGENAAVVSLLTEHHGRHAGLVHGARGRRARGLYQPGNALTARWQARLAEHLGRYTCELVRARASLVLDDPPRLAALAAVCALVEATLPERHPYPQVYGSTGRLLDTLEASERWAEAVVRWELALLAELGFGLDLSACAATGSVEDLAYVSPRSGRAVSQEAAAPYAEKLLSLPSFLTRPEDAAAVPAADIVAGLRLTGWFFEKHVFAEQGGRMPAARERFIDRLQTGGAPPPAAPTAQDP